MFLLARNEEGRNVFFRFVSIVSGGVPIPPHTVHNGPVFDWAANNFFHEVFALCTYPLRRYRFHISVLGRLAMVVLSSSCWQPVNTGSILYTVVFDSDDFLLNYNNHKRARLFPFWPMWLTIIFLSKWIVLQIEEVAIIVKIGQSDFLVKFCLISPQVFQSRLTQILSKKTDSVEQGRA